MQETKGQGWDHRKKEQALQNSRPLQAASEGAPMSLVNGPTGLGPRGRLLGKCRQRPDRSLRGFEGERHAVSSQRRNDRVGITEQDGIRRYRGEQAQIESTRGAQSLR